MRCLSIGSTDCDHHYHHSRRRITFLSSVSNLHGGGIAGDDDEDKNAPNNEVSSPNTTQQRQRLFSSDNEVTSYYLIWSPGFLKKFFVASSTLLGLHLIGWDIQLGRLVSQKLRMSVGGGGSSIIPNFLLPMLSSSCCLLQLLINVFVGAGGCAGFNTLLGPVRPYFLSMLVFLNAVTGGANIKQLLLRFTLALLPEGVYFWNSHATKRWQQKRIENMKKQEQNSSSSMIRATMIVEIPTMGCVACINKIESKLRQCDSTDKIVSATSWLENDRKGGSAKVDVIVDSEEELDEVKRMVVTTIESAGFEGSTISNLQITAGD